MPVVPRLLQVLVGGGDQTDVHPDGLVAADPLELPGLEHAQELGLRGRAELADLVEEQGAAVGLLELALAPGLRAGERPALVAEQLGLDQGLGQRRAVDPNERLPRPRRVVMQRVGDQLLAGAALAPDHDGGIGAHDLRHLVVHPAHRPAVADDVGQLVALPQLLAELGVLLDESLALAFHQAMDPDRLRHHRRRDPEHLHHPLGVPLGHERQLDRERPGARALHQDGHAQEAHLLLVPPRVARDGAMEEVGLLAQPRDHGRRPALGDGAGDALAHPVAHPSRGARIADRRLDDQEPARPPRAA